MQTIFTVNGKNQPLTPGTKIEYEMPDMYGQGMTKPDVSEDLFNLDKK